MSAREAGLPTRPESPCIKVCRPVGELCLGCHRTLDEIARWSRMDAAQREAVWQRLDAQARRAADAQEAERRAVAQRG
ncbi:DUF1289 domain-containing protein [Halomonas sp. A11-A]|uniref:DUF1289 domain-containing protein n=1 Tax=Halomonas sp. A11-A TaxID=2183985 RepID=UPI000D7150BF|nr:DUF1289 domain-containing protein [Halomonas sp. A11-A]PWV72082.1 putative Fe-S protein YdhL (DUF1289 family) [Halomonas sp. A11-A]